MKRNLMFKVLLMLMVGCFLSIDAFAQQMTVKGLVKDSNDNFIGHCWRLCPQTQEPSDIRLKVFFVILGALEQSLSSNRLRLKPLEAS